MHAEDFAILHADRSRRFLRSRQIGIADQQVDVFRGSHGRRVFRRHPQGNRLPADQRMRNADGGQRLRDALQSVGNVVEGHLVPLPGSGGSLR